MIDLILKKGKERSLLRRHPWVYDTAVQKVMGKPGLGETVRVVSYDGRFLAWAAYSHESTSRARCWSFIESECIDKAWFEEKIIKALRARKRLFSRTSAVRVIFGEADQLPGLVVDQYGDWLVAQFQAAGVEAWKDVIAGILMKQCDVQGIYERSDAATRHREGLSEIVGVLRGAEPPQEIEIVEDGVRYGVDVRHGHKTGFYIDQRENRLLAQRLAAQFKAQHGRGMRALNCFCYTGGFSLALLAGGAEEVISVDSSADALAMAQRNAERNGFGHDRAQWLQADVFDYLRQARDRGEEFDLVILDPPKFASSHRHIDRASRAYKDINLNGLRLVKEGGDLLTFSCSGAMDVDLFQKVIAGAVIDSKREAWMIARLGAGEDHPLMMTCPEGEYLKGLQLALR